MSINPCPACESDYDGDWSHGTAGPQLVCGNPGCKLCGPCGIDMEDAEKRWNAMPRRGDGPAWRKEPPDEPGWWWKRLRYSGGGATSPWAVEIGDIKAEAMFYGELAGRYEWAGPIPAPVVATDAEKEE